tara:strand:- start:432 stop:680 length:249 start_codon:yes stop_codon:yes gene_type:complete
VKKGANVSVSENDLNRTRRRGRKTPVRGDNSEALIRRFIKKCKKERVVKIYVEKTEYHKTKSQKKREKKNRAIRRQRKERSR